MNNFRTPFLGGAYEARSLNLAAQRCVNLYPETVETKEGKEVAALLGCPGMTKRLTLAAAGEVRGLLTVVVDGTPTLYAVCGTKLYSINTSWTATEQGTLTGSTGRVGMAWNGFQVIVVEGANGYTYNPGTDTFAAIADADFPGADTVCFIDTYFLVNDPDTGRFYISGQNDGTTWDALDFATAEAVPDDLVAVFADHRELWGFGELSVQVFTNTGNADFPFESIGNVFIEQGCAAAFSPAKIDNSVFWLSANENGQGMVMRAEGYTPRRISTHAIEHAIQGYSDISDAIGFAYQQEGHSFYVLVFPTGEATWVYDAATGLWHERAWWDDDNDVFKRHRANCHAFFNGYHVVGDWEDGRIYTLHLDVYKDDTDYIRWLRAWRALPAGQNNLSINGHRRLQLDMEAGVGLASGQGSDPQVMLRWSDDGGHTWSSELWRSIGGNTGEFGKRAVWRNLGSTRKGRDRVYELSGTDPVKRAFMGAWLRLEKRAA